MGAGAPAEHSRGNLAEGGAIAIERAAGRQRRDRPAAVHEKGLLRLPRSGRTRLPDHGASPRPQSHAAAGFHPLHPCAAWPDAAIHREGPTGRGAGGHLRVSPGKAASRADRPSPAQIVVLPRITGPVICPNCGTIMVMKRISIQDLKAGLSALVAEASSGSTIVI